MISPGRRTRVLLAHSFFLRHDDKQTRRMRPYPPLATLLAAAALRREGVDVRLFDATLAGSLADFSAALDEHDPQHVAIVEDNFNFITKMCTARMRSDALQMVRLARARGCRVAVNGSDAVDHSLLYLEAGADVVINGEVEPVLCDVVSAWTRGDDASGVAGITVLRGGALQRTGARPYHDDLDALPFPAWDLVDAAQYHAAWRQAHGRSSLNAVTSRGCPYGCNWCAKPIWGRRYAQRSPRLAAEDVRQLRDVAAPDHLWFADDIFGLTPSWIEEFAREIVQRDAVTPFMMQSRANLMTPRSVAALHAAGAEEVWLGVESGSQSVLDAMDKGTTLEQIRMATTSLKQAGIRTGWFVMLGYPGEEWTDILRTRDLIREQQPHDIGVSVAYPLPGTVFHQRVRAQLGIKRNWSDTNDLAMLFQGAYDTGFYRRVRDLLHGEAEGVRADDEWTALAGLHAAGAEELEMSLQKPA